MFDKTPRAMALLGTFQQEQGDSRLDMSGKRNADDYVIYNKA